MGHAYASCDEITKAESCFQRALSVIEDKEEKSKAKSRSDGADSKRATPDARGRSESDDLGELSSVGDRKEGAAVVPVSTTPKRVGFDDACAGLQQFHRGSVLV